MKKDARPDVEWNASAQLPDGRTKWVTVKAKCWYDARAAAARELSVAIGDIHLPQLGEKE